AAVEAGKLDALGIAAAPRPTEAASALLDSLSLHSEVAVEALVLAAAATCLPFLRDRGPWPALALGGGTIAALLLLAPQLPILSAVLYTTVAYALLVLAPRLRRGSLGDRPTAETLPAVLPFRTAREVAGRG
ncbi:MAG: hypothetical protein C4306_06945, partial [Thermoleophilia bacterium]